MSLQFLFLKAVCEDIAQREYMIWPWDHEAISGRYKLLFIIKRRLILVINNFISGRFKWHFNFVPVFNQEILRLKS